jgi:uncharacterized protein (TIGR02599 family)
MKITTIAYAGQSSDPGNIKVLSGETPVVTAASQPKPRRRYRGFTLPELLVAMTVLSILLLMLTELLNQVQKTWTYSENRISQFREARVGFDVITKNLSQASLNTYWDYDRDSDGKVLRYKRQSELNFITDKSSKLSLQGDTLTHALFFQAPLGRSDRYNNLSALYNARGYYVEFGDDKKYKPSFVQAAPKYRYRLMEYLPPAEENQIYNDGDEERYEDSDPIYDKWFNYKMDEFTHPLADNIIALVLSPRESVGDVGSDSDASKIAPDYSYNSNQPNARFSGKPPQQVPPLVKVTMVAIDEASAIRFEQGGSQPPQIASAVAGLFESANNFNKDIESLESSLRDSGVNYRVFSSMVPIRSSKWSTYDPGAAVP